MKEMERITVTLTSELADVVRDSVDNGDYASNSEVIREALRDWKLKKVLQETQLNDLYDKIQAGRFDIEAGRVKKFDSARIVRKGRKKLNKNASSA